MYYSKSETDKSFFVNIKDLRKFRKPKFKYLEENSRVLF